MDVYCSYLTTGMFATGYDTNGNSYIDFQGYATFIPEYIEGLDNTDIISMFTTSTYTMSISEESDDSANYFVGMTSSTIACQYRDSTTSRGYLSRTWSNIIGGGAAIGNLQASMNALQSSVTTSITGLTGSVNTTISTSNSTKTTVLTRSPILRRCNISFQMDASQISDPSAYGIVFNTSLLLSEDAIKNVIYFVQGVEFTDLFFGILPYLGFSTSVQTESYGNGTVYTDLNYLQGIGLFRSQDSSSYEPLVVYGIIVDEDYKSVKLIAGTYGLTQPGSFLPDIYSMSYEELFGNTPLFSVTITDLP